MDHLVRSEMLTDSCCLLLRSTIVGVFGGRSPFKFSIVICVAEHVDGSTTPFCCRAYEELKYARLKSMREVPLSFYIVPRRA